MTVFKKKYTKSRTYKRKLNLSSKVKNLSKEVRKLKSGVELLCHDEVPSSAFTNANQVGNVGEIHCLSNMAEGDGMGGRTGLKISTQSMQVIADLNKAGAASTTKLRFILFIDRQHVGVTPLATDLLESDSILAFPNRKNKARFQILVDKRIQLNSLSRNATHLKYYKKFKNPIDMRFDGSTVNDTAKNPLYLYIISNEGVNRPSVYMYTRMRYTDV